MRQAFDELAEGYDRAFTGTPIGRAQRAAAWRRLAPRLRPGLRVLELGCGTGEDAVFMAEKGVSVLATDPSPPMLEAARRKATDAGVGNRIDLRRLGAEHLEALAGDPPFDAAFSNFGALNCVEDLRPVASELGRLVRPGGWAGLCLLGRWVPWEWLWYLARARPRQAFRRLRPRGVPWRGMTVRYPPVRAVRRAFDEHWRLERLIGIGVAVPPSYTGSWFGHRPRLLSALDAADRGWAGLPLLNRLGDHVLFVFTRR